jgi:hypothetical protein
VVRGPSGRQAGRQARFTNQDAELDNPKSKIDNRDSMDVLWLLLAVPLVAGVAVVYKAVRLDDLRRLPREAGRLTLVVLSYMTLAAVALWAWGVWG